jgi:hypothetical protein
MTTPLIEQPTPQTTPAPDRRGRAVAGVALIIIGLLVLATQVLQSAQLALMIPAALGVIFLAWGLITRNFGLTIPGCILLGVGVGTYLTVNPPSVLEGMNQGGVFMLAFAGGWVLMALLSPLTRSGFQWWPLIPAAVMAVVGIALLRGGAAMQLMQVMGYAWPLILVAIGAYLLLKRRS